MEETKIAVIIPAYNSEKMIERCLNSILYQTFIDFKVIIVNDGSTDNTLELIESFAKKDSRFIVINQENKGASVARNVGYNNSSSKYVTFVDADDSLTPDALEHLYRHIEENKNDYVIGAKKIIRLNGKTTRFMPKEFFESINCIAPSNLESLRKIRFHIAPHGKLIRRSFLEKNKITFVEHWTYEDFLYSYTLLLTAKSIGIVKDICYYYIINNLSISNTPLKKHNISSRIEIEKLIWKFCKEKDLKKRIYDNPQLFTFSYRFYNGHISLLGWENNEFQKDAYNQIKKIVKEYINIIMKISSNKKRIIYLAIYNMEFEEYYNFKKGIEAQSPKFVYLKDGNIYLNNDLSSRFSLDKKDTKIGEYPITDNKTRLELIKKEIVNYEKVWIYESNIVVVDCEINKNKIAFDFLFNNDNDELKVHLFSRNKPESLSQFTDELLDVKSNKLLIFKGNKKDYKKACNTVNSFINKIKEEKTTQLQSNNLEFKDILSDKILKNQELKNENKIAINSFEIPDSIKYDFTIKNVLEREMCIGCGACSIVTQNKIEIKQNSYGIYEANLNDIDNLSEKDFNTANAVCPFSNVSLNENQLDVPNEIYRSLPYDNKIGRYDTIFTAKKTNEEELIQSSSGGMTSWLINKLFRENKIDAVLHVGRVDSENLFEYKISYSIEEAEQNKKSAYYSITLKDVLEKIKKETNLRYAIVGIPCMIKATRLLAEKDMKIKNSIIYYLGLVCGHLKSSFFAQSNAWQCGVNPKDLKSVDFRVKNKSNPASRYNFSAISKSSNKVSSKVNNLLVGGSWGYAGFQPNACNYCDDIFSETADVVFADAWLNEYTKDWSGTNLVISRNKELSNLFNNGLESKEIKAKNITLEDAVKSQAGGLRHRRDGLKIRLYNDINKGLKVPVKRVEASILNIPKNRIELIKQRQNISKLSLEYFKQAKEKNDLNFFLESMKGQVELYKHISKLKYPKVKKQKYYDIALFGWHYNPNLGGFLTVFAIDQFLKENGFSVVIVPKPGKHKITDGNKANYEIGNKYYKYAKQRPFEKLHELRSYCDTFVLASDQLWAGKWIEFKPEFEFLACGDKSVKKISVSTSLGGEGKKLPFDNTKKEIVKYHLKKMDYISVREPSGVDILKNEGIEATQILDPVFLCSSNIYKDLISQSKLEVKENYIAGYILDFEKSLINFGAVNIANKLNIKNNIFTTTMGDAKKRNDILIKKWNSIEDVNFYSHSSIAEFVHMISKASFVITDSFHGACICVIFNKPFICAAKASRGTSRFELFDKLGLSNRIMNRDKLDISIVDSKIDWDEVNNKLDKMRVESYKWLSKAFDKEIKNYT